MALKLLSFAMRLRADYKLNKIIKIYEVLKLYIHDSRIQVTYLYGPGVYLNLAIVINFNKYNKSSSNLLRSNLKSHNYQIQL